MMLQGLKEELNRIQPIAHFGFVKTIIGSLIHVTGLNTLVSVGSVC